MHRLAVSWPVLPILLRREAGAAAAVTVDLFNSAADIIVADVQHVEARTCAVVHQGGAVQKTKTALCKCSLHTQFLRIKSLWKVQRDSMMDLLLWNHKALLELQVWKVITVNIQRKMTARCTQTYTDNSDFHN